MSQRKHFELGGARAWNAGDLAAARQRHTIRHMFPNAGCDTRAKTNQAHGTLSDYILLGRAGLEGGDLNSLVLFVDSATVIVILAYAFSWTGYNGEASKKGKNGGVRR